MNYLLIFSQEQNPKQPPPPPINKFVTIRMSEWPVQQTCLKCSTDAINKM